MKKLSILMCLFFVASIQADNHTKAEKEVAIAFNKYFDARVNQLGYCCCDGKRKEHTIQILMGVFTKH